MSTNYTVSVSVSGGLTPSANCSTQAHIVLSVYFRASYKGETLNICHQLNPGHTRKQKDRWKNQKRNNYFHSFVALSTNVSYNNGIWFIKAL